MNFRIADYDHSKPLIIDPVLSYSTYVGISGDTFMAATADGAGNTYLAGRNSRIDFSGKTQSGRNYRATATDPRTTTYSFTIQAVAASATGQLYIAGSASSDFPPQPGLFWRR